MSKNEMIQQPYHGWENKCTWLMHLHLSNEAMRLLSWDMLGSALAYADWVQLVERLTSGGAPEGILFTTTRYRSVLRSNSFQQYVVGVARASISLSAGADVVKDWFEVQ